MNRNLFRLSVVGAIIVACVAAPFLIQYHARIQWQERKALLRQQTERFAEFSAENKRLSNLLAQTRSPSLSSDQFRELLRLRGEIAQLRKNAHEMTRLQAARQQSLAAFRNPDAQSAPALPDPQTVQAYWPKAQLTFAGYANPASALQTGLWAMSSKDPVALAASVTPETMSKLIEGGSRAALWVMSRNDPDALAGRVAPETKYQALTDKISPAEGMEFQAKAASDSLGPASGFYVVEQDPTSRIPGLNPDQQILKVYFEKEGATRRFALKKIGDEWKIEGIYATGGNDGEAQLGAMLWP